MDFNEEDVERAIEEAESQPTYRATVRRGKVMLTGWAGWLAGGGAWNALLEARGRAGAIIADITIAGEDESDVIVKFINDGRTRPDAEEALILWARNAGHRRIWIADRMVSFDGDNWDREGAEVKCPSCGANWHDRTPDFWDLVNRQGAFPRWCVLCGWELPQWKVKTKAEADLEELDEMVKRSEKSPRRKRPSRRVGS